MIARSDTISKTKIEPQCASMTAECTKKFDVVVRSLQLCHRKNGGSFPWVWDFAGNRNPFLGYFWHFSTSGVFNPVLAKCADK